MGKIHPKLQEIRTRTDLKIKPSKYLKQTFTGFDGQEHPLKIRYYQVQGMLHLIASPRFVLGDDTGTGKALMTIGSLCHIWDKEPDLKAIILTTKSAVPQLAGEFDKFSTGINIVVCKGTAVQRSKAREKFLSLSGPTVLITGYRAVVQDFSEIQEWQGHILVMDEISAVKNPKSQVHQVCHYLAQKANRVWGMTATLIKNNLMEGYGIYRVVDANVFPESANAFMLYYCITRMQRLPRTNRMVPVIVGYAPDKIREFRERIDPYFLGRAKHEVASELPSLSIKTIEVGLSPQQEIKYQEALAGLLVTKLEEKETDKLTAIIYCQQIVDHLELVDCDGESEKLDTLMGLLTEGDYAEEKIIVFSRFRRMVDIIMRELAKAKVSAVRITGAENEEQRLVAMKSFQDPNSDVRVICITMAASEAINLQASKALIFYDTPWSAGDLLQILGRMIRIGSVHDKCFAIHLVAKGRKKSVDHRVMEVQGKKMQLIEAVIGKRIKGETDTQAEISVGNDISDLFAALQADARE